MAQTLQGMISNFLYILLYLGFLFASRGGFDRKLKNLFPLEDRRGHAQTAFQHIRNGIERYLWIQTVTGLMIARRLDHHPRRGGYAERGLLGLPDPGLQLCADHRRHGRTVPAADVRPGGVQHLLAAGRDPGGADGDPDHHGQHRLPRMQGRSLNLDPVVILLALSVLGSGVGSAGHVPVDAPDRDPDGHLRTVPGARWVAILLSQRWRSPGRGGPRPTPSGEPTAARQGGRKPRRAALTQA
ncbi:MAG: hypothetical protein WDN45_07035 [Caulobacteraceae bacterium]